MHVFVIILVYLSKGKFYLYKSQSNMFLVPTGTEQRG